jgi:hypothetical protein
MLLVRRHGGDDFLLWWQGCRLHMCRSQPTPLPLQLQREINGEFWKRGSFRSGSNTGAGKGGDRADKIARCGTDAGLCYRLDRCIISGKQARR